MGLPVRPLATDTVMVAGEPVTIRALSRADVVELAGMDEDIAGAEVLVLSRSCGITPEEAQEWRTQVDPATANDLLDAIRELTGLGNPRPSSSSTSAG